MTDFRTRMAGGRHLATAAVVATACWAATPASAQTHIKIAGLTEITGATPLTGASTSAGYKLGVKETNEAGGVLGRQVDLIIADNQTDPTVIVSEAKRLASVEKVDGVLGPSLTQLVLASLPIFTEAKIPQITTGSSSLETPQAGPYHFAMIYNADDASHVLVDQAVDVAKAKSVAIFVDNGGQSKAAAIALKQRIDELKIKLAGEQQYELHANDMTPQLLALKNTNPDAILFFTSSPDDVGKLLTTLTDLGWGVNVVGNLSMATFAPNVLKLTGPAAFSHVLGQVYTGLSYCPSDPVGQSDYAKFRERMKAFTPDFDKIGVLTATYAYDSTMLMLAAMKGAGSTEGSKVAAWIEQNAGSYKATTAQLGIPKGTHFLFPPEALKLATDLASPRSDGLYKRVGC